MKRALVPAVLLVLAGAPARCSEPALPAVELGGVEPAVAGAIREAEAAVRSSAPGGERAGRIGELGLRLEAHGFDGAAEDAYRAAEAELPAEVRWPAHLARLLERTGRLAEAAAACDRALRLDPGDLSTRFRLAEVRRAEGRLDDAEALLREVLAGSPGSAAALAALGKLALARGDAEGAERALAAALRSAPGAGSLRRLRARALLALSQPEEARRELALGGEAGVAFADRWESELAKSRIGSSVHRLRGRAALRAHDAPGAVRELRLAVTSDPGDPGTRIDLAVALARSGRLVEAEAELLDALRGAPGNADALANLGRLRLAAGRAMEALPPLSAAVLRNPRDAASQQDLAELLRRLGRPAEALAPAREAACLQPAEVPPRVLEASLLEAGGRSVEAVVGLERALEELGSDPQLTAALARLLAASADPAVRNGPAAVDLALHLFGDVPSPAAAELLADALAESADCSGSTAFLALALRLGAERNEERAAKLARSAAGSVCRPPFGPPQLLQLPAS